MNTIIYYLETSEGLQFLELEEEPLNFKDFIQDIINAGYSDFRLYDSLCNYGGLGLIVEVKNSKIKEFRGIK